MMLKKMFSYYGCSEIDIRLIINELINLLPRFAVLFLLKVKKKKGNLSSAAFLRTTMQRYANFPIPPNFSV